MLSQIWHFLNLYFWDAYHHQNSKIFHIFFKVNSILHSICLYY